MSALKTLVEFRSDAFPAHEEEEAQVNPGRFGKRLAEFLVAGLRSEGFETGEPIAEDWGWGVAIKNEAFPLWIGCGNYEEYPDGFLCFIEPHQPILRKFFFKKIDTTGPVNAIQAAIDKLLSQHESVHSKRWWTYEEFNNPDRA